MAGVLWRVELIDPKRSGHRAPKFVRASSRDEAIGIAVRNLPKWKKSKWRIGSVAQSTAPDYGVSDNPGVMAKRKGGSTHTYKTESAFRKALAKFTANGELVHWYGTDHGWVIVTRKMTNPKRGGLVKGAKVRRLPNGTIHVHLPAKYRGFIKGVR